MHQLEIIRVLSEAKDRLIVERAQICSAEMDRVLGVCRKRKGELQKILEQCRIWEQLRSAIEHWLNEGEQLCGDFEQFTKLENCGIGIS